MDKPTIHLSKRKVLVFLSTGYFGREFENCTEIKFLGNNEIELIYDYQERNSFGATSYTTIRINDIEEIKIY